MEQPVLVFIHGYLGAFAPKHFVWRHWRSHFREWEHKGLTVVVPALRASASLEHRSVALNKALSPYRNRKLILVGHSMGGLDAKYFALRHAADGQVCAIMTIGTPHRGSPLAKDMLHQRGVFAWLTRLIDRGALKDLHQPPEWIHETALPSNIIRYGVTGAMDIKDMPPLARGFGRRLQSLEGPNDAQVAVKSARFGTETLELEADHWQLIGWNYENPFRSQLPRIRDTRLEVKATIDRMIEQVSSKIRG